MLLGGYPSTATTELLSREGDSSQHFPLRYDTAWVETLCLQLSRYRYVTRYACAIEMPDQVILTGGRYIPNQVSFQHRQLMMMIMIMLPWPGVCVR